MERLFKITLKRPIKWENSVIDFIDNVSEVDASEILRTIANKHIYYYFIGDIIIEQKNILNVYNKEHLNIGLIVYDNFFEERRVINNIELKNYGKNKS